MSQAHINAAKTYRADTIVSSHIDGRHVSITLNDAEWRRLDALARSRNLARTTLARMLMLSAMEREA